RAGVLINVDTKDAAVLFDKLQTGDYEAIPTSLSGGYVPESSANVFTCDGNLHFFNVICPFEKRNNPQVDYEKFEKKVDDFYGNGAVAQEIKEAKKIWDDAQILIGEFQPMIYIVQMNALFAYRTDVLRNHGRAPLANQDVVYCLNGKCRGG
ncbi:hypothetical protein HY009_04305, partial [Candidatus Acetothermia bacterium]|nr:hypothetical protein [Candidatus Acetothermia bacterium]